MRFLYFFRILIIFTAIFGAASSCAAPLPVLLELETDRSVVTVGDSLTVFCRISSLPDIEIESIGIDQSDASFDIENQWTVPPSPDQQDEITLGFLLYAFSPDTLKIGPAFATYQTADGDSGTAVSNTLILPVTSLVDSPDAQPQPNRTPFAIASRGIPLWIIVLSLIILGIAIFILMKFFRKSKKTTIEIPKPVDEIEEFERIRGLHLIDDGKVKEHYLLLSFALRGFIYRNMNFDARMETTDEISRHLEHASFDSGIMDGILDMLRESDMVKFARYTPPAELSKTAIDRALHPVKTVLEEIERRKKIQEEQKQMSSENTVSDTETPNPTNQSGE